MLIDVCERKRQRARPDSFLPTVNWLGLHVRSWISQSWLVEKYNRFFLFYTPPSERPCCQCLRTTTQFYDIFTKRNKWKAGVQLSNIMGHVCESSGYLCSVIGQESVADTLQQQHQWTITRAFLSTEMFTTCAGGYRPKQLPGRKNSRNSRLSNVESEKLSHFKANNCVQPLPSAVNTTLLALAATRRAVGLLLRAGAYYRSISPDCGALSSKLAGGRCYCRSMGQTDGQTDGRSSVA